MKEHSQVQVNLIAESIKKFGFNEEEWRFVEENECYVVTKCGRIFSVCRIQRSKTGNVFKKYRTVELKGSLDKDGYKTIRMVVSNRKVHAKLHRLIGKAFLQRIGGKNVINHKNGDKQNNSCLNLEWVTSEENLHHAIENGLLNPRLGGMKNAKVLRCDYAMIHYLFFFAGINRKEISQMYRVCRQTIDGILTKTNRLFTSVMEIQNAQS